VSIRFDCGKSALLGNVSVASTAGIVDGVAVKKAFIEARVLRLAQRKPADGSTHWSTRKIAAEVGTNHVRVTSILAKAGLQHIDCAAMFPVTIRSSRKKPPISSVCVSSRRSMQRCSAPNYISANWTTMKTNLLHEVAILGAGPYGLATAAHLRAVKIETCVFGEPMEFWEKSDAGRHAPALVPGCVSYYRSASSIDP